MRTHVLDEKSIPASKIEDSWAMGYSLPSICGSYLVPTWFLLDPYLVLTQFPGPMPLLK
jgi:hypothetical protein